MYRNIKISLPFLLVLYFFGTQQSYGLTTSADITDILAVHNQYRAAKCVQNIHWDASIALIAQNYSANCKFVHSGITGYGENIAYGTGYNTKSLVQLWANEIDDYTCGDPNGINNAGHYTQIMWNTTTLVGCGITTCSFGKFLVCNYKAPGNYIGRNPYTCPDQCSASPVASESKPTPISQATTSKPASGKATTAPSSITTSSLTTSDNGIGVENIEDNDLNGANDENHNKLIGLPKPAAIGVILVLIVVTAAVTTLAVIALVVLRRRRSAQRSNNSLIINTPEREEQPPSPEVVVTPTPEREPAMFIPSTPLIAPNLSVIQMYSGSPTSPLYGSPTAPRSQLPGALARSFTVGTMCQAMWSGDSQFYRARIEDISGNNYLVSYVDFGDQQEWVTRGRLRTVRS